MKWLLILAGGKLMLKIASAVAFAAVVSTSAIAQDAVQASAAPVAAPQVVRTLPASTLVSVTPDEEISSKKVQVGDKVYFSVVNDITVGSDVAIPRGSKVQGTIKWKTGKAIGGKSGKFEVNFDTVTVGGHAFAMRGIHRQEGKGNTAAALFGSMLVSGRSASMIPGQFANAFTAEPISF